MGESYWFFIEGKVFVVVLLVEISVFFRALGLIEADGAELKEMKV